MLALAVKICLIFSLLKPLLEKGIENVVLLVECLEIRAHSVAAKCNLLMMKCKLEDFLTWKHPSFFAPFTPKMQVTCASLESTHTEIHMSPNSKFDGKIP